MHAIDAQKEIISLMGEIDDTGPLPSKEGRILVAMNVLASVMAGPAEGDDRPRRMAKCNEEGDSFISVDEAMKWIDHVVQQLPICVAMIGNFGSSRRLR